MDNFDFDGAITMHKAWKMKFHLALDRISGADYDTAPLGDAAQCALGRWLVANSGELSAYAAARELPEVHREFHRRSEQIAADIRDGRIVKLGDRTIVEFGVLSEKIEGLLLQLKKDVGQAA